MDPGALEAASEATLKRTWIGHHAPDWSEADAEGPPNLLEQATAGQDDSGVPYGVTRPADSAQAGAEPPEGIFLEQRCMGGAALPLVRD